MKDLDIFVKVGTTDHPAKIDSMVRLSEELVNTANILFIRLFITAPL